MNIGIKWRSTKQQRACTNCERAPTINNPWACPKIGDDHSTNTERSQLPANGVGTILQRHG